MSTTIVSLPDQSTARIPKMNFLTKENGLLSWLLTGDHKRIATLYLISITFFFFIGGALAGLIRLELLTPQTSLMAADTYNKVFTMHGVIMIFFFLVPSVPATLGNFFIPMMIGAKDLALPKINLLSWYLYVIGGCMGIYVMATGGVDTGWTFTTPLSTHYLNTHVISTAMAAFVAGFSSVFTGLNFIVTIHKMRAPGMTWFRLPLFVWANYAASVLMVLATPVLAITLVLIMLERAFGIGVFDPAKGGDPLLFQHLFWFYSHPAVYIMILPGMGVISEVISTFSRKRVFGYTAVAFSSVAIAVFGFFGRSIGGQARPPARDQIQAWLLLQHLDSLPRLPIHDPGQERKGKGQASQHDRQRGQRRADQHPAPQIEGFLAVGRGCPQCRCLAWPLRLQLYHLSVAGRQVRPLFGDNSHLRPTTAGSRWPAH